jgi:hypothetical protein
MNSNLKMILLLAAVVATVSGITVISQFTSRTTPEDAPKPVVPGSQQPAATEVAEPLRYSLRTMRFDPASEEQEHRLFQGAYEVNDNLNWVSYWVHNPNSVPVEVSARGRSCSQCSEARIAVLPDASTQDFLKLAATASLVNLTGMPDILGAIAATRYCQDAQKLWQPLSFDDPNATVKVPGKTDGRATNALIQLGFKAKAVGPKDLTATIGLRTPDMNVPLTVDFKVFFEGVSPFEVSPTLLELGDFPEKSPPKTVEVLFWSATRKLKDLAPPIGAGKDPFVQFDTPIALTDAEIQTLPIVQPSKVSFPVRIQSAYRVRMTMHRDDPTASPGKPPRALDIGPSTRLISLTTSSAATETKTVTIKANVLGAVALRDGGSFNLGEYNARNGVVKSATLVSEKPDLELEAIADQIYPRFLKVTLEDPKVAAGRRTWNVIVEVKKNEGLGDLPVDSVLAFRVKGTDQMIRIPVKGRGFLR